MSKQIRITSNGSQFDAYLALPEAGSGPVVVLLQEIFGVNADMREVADLYASEGYVVLAPDLFHQFEPNIQLGYGEADHALAFDYYQRFDVARALDDIRATVEFARSMPQSTGKVGALGFCLGGKLAYLAAADCGVDCAVGYYGVGIQDALDLAAKIDCPVALHFGATDPLNPPEAVESIKTALGDKPNVKLYVYPEAGHAFNRSGPTFVKTAAMPAHTRSLDIFRKTMGPDYDLSALADHHFYLEFAARDPEATMQTMVPQPYVNHVPTMTGGTGYTELKRFYANHFIHNNPADTKMVPISRVVGVDRMVDEFILCFTHDCEIDWLLPGVAPTGKYVEIPMLVVVGFRGPKLYNEHIYWDQASVLVQIGLLDPTGLPVSGIEAARKLMNEKLPSNTLMARWKDSAPA
ncbi:dienelactone hydrolase family protein [Paraburkholderia susongensis]|uniref:Carboxymethylenebutenolidase n=1 Tax=Paraburkholderia susongensis TaxID=1515439 RepID=A0A1X7IBT7_9BURK|nr:dienelactone hydrolase family protein [Paraburkholderia susongensis]SMG11904.1 carboxymethylenebutenolidase [Paraburkholderia susongensis]